jgi:hypothetical protein
MQHAADSLLALDREEPSLLSQLVHYAGKMPEQQLHELVAYLRKKQIIEDTAALGKALRTQTPFPISFDELGMLLEKAEKEAPDVKH